jgi:hypothetical protein
MCNGGMLHHEAKISLRTQISCGRRWRWCKICPLDAAAITPILHDAQMAPNGDNGRAASTVDVLLPEKDLGL